MTVDKAVLVFAGFMILLSVSLTYYVHPAWMLLTIFVGLNLIQSAFTRVCPAATVFKMLGFKPGALFR